MAGNRWNILGFNFTKRDALSSVYKISMNITHYLCQSTFIHKSGPSSPSRAYFVFDQLTNIATIVDVLGKLPICDSNNREIGGFPIWKIGGFRKSIIHT